MSILVNDQTKQQLAPLRRGLPGSLLLYGQSGVGLATIAADLVGDRQTIWIRPTDKDNNVDYDKGVVRISQIRRLYEQTRSRRVNQLVVVIDEADRMQLPAQAAFLKLLEEPNQQTNFILLAHTPDKLQPTIRSRVQSCHIRPISQAQSIELLSTLGVSDGRKQTQLLYIASGLPAELCRLVANEAYFQSEAKLTTDARDLLKASVYERLCLVGRYQTSRESAIKLCDRALALARRSMSDSPQTGLIHQLERLLEVRSNLAASHSVRLQLAEFALG